MKNNFKKITAIAAGALMVGMTMGNAVALSPSDNAFDAVVYGANADSSDQTQAESISSWLGLSSGASSTVTGGEVFSLGKSSDEFQLGYNLSSVYSELDDNDMESFLADGEYDDGDIDEDYSQKIILGDGTNLGLFADNDYDEDETPTLGFAFDDDLIMSYKITFDTALTDYEDLESTDLPLMGQEYYVLDAASNELTLLDSSEKTMISEGETVNIGDKTITIEYIDADSAKFAVNGEVTDKLSDDGTNGDKYFELSDESYIVLNENLYASKDTGISKAEVSIGKGKISLDFEGNEIELNEDPVDGLTSTITSDGTTSINGVATDDVKDITISWYADGEEFLVEGETMEMPTFETMKVLFGGIDFPSDTEKISVDKGDTLTLSMENFDVEVLEATDATTITAGSINNPLKNVATSAASSSTFFLADDERFIATYLDEDLSDVEQLYYEASALDVTGASDDEFSLDLEDLTDGDKDISFDAEDAGYEDTSRGDITVKLDIVYEAGAVVGNSSVANTATVINETEAGLIGAGTTYFDVNGTEGDTLKVDVAKVTVTHEDGSTLYFDRVVSKTGLIIDIPTTSDLAGTGEDITFYEAADDGDLQWTSASWTTDLQWDDTDDYVYAAKGSTLSFKETSDDKYLAYVDGDLATKINVDEDSDSYDVTYYGDEVVADVSVASADAVVTSTSGSMVFTDAEKSEWANMNVVLVGGSCINTAAAEALGVSAGTCGAAFTDATNVGTGQYIIKVVGDAFTTGKTALVVAGYEKENTEAAVNYLKSNENKDPMIDIEDGNTYFGTTGASGTSTVTLM